MGALPEYAVPRQRRLVYDDGPALMPRRARSEAQARLVGALGRRATKAQAIIEALRRGPLSSLEMLQVGGLRYHARLAELRSRGFSIRAVPDGDGWSYRLIEEPA